MGDFKTFDFDKAKQIGSNDEIVDYLLNRAKTNINWDFFNNQDNNQIVNRLSEKADKLEIYDDGINQEQVKARVQQLQEEAKPQNFLQSAKDFGANALSVVDNVSPIPLKPIIEPILYDNDKDYQERKEKSLQAAKLAQDYQLDPKALNDKTKADFLREKGEFDINLYATNGLTEAKLKGYEYFFNKDNYVKSVMERERKKDLMLNKNYGELNPEEKQLFENDEGGLNRAWDSMFKDNTKAFEEWKEKRFATQEISKELQRKITHLNAIHEGKSIRDIFFGDTETKQKYLDDVADVAYIVGFDSAGFDEKGDLYLVKDGNLIQVNEGFFYNFWDSLSAVKGELAGGIAGSIAGLKRGKTLQGKIAGSILGGALGSALGASTDVLAANAYLDRDNTARELIGHSLEAGFLSAAGDGVILTLSKQGKPALKFGLNQVKKLNEGLKDTFFYGTLRNIPDQNLRGAQKIINQSYTDEDKQALREFGEVFGGALSSGDKNTISALKESLQGREFPLKSSAMSLLNAMDKPTLKEAQLEIIEQIRADKSGATLRFLLEVANESPQVQKNLKDILNQTTHNLEKSLSGLGLDEISMQEIFQTIKTQTKQSYDEAMNLTLGELYDESYKTIVDSKPYLDFKQELEDSGLLLSDQQKRYLDKIEKNVFNPAGTTFKQLENSRKMLNSFYNDIQDPNIKQYIQNSINKVLRDTIKGGIDDILSQNKQMYHEAVNLYENALSDYAAMLQISKLQSVKKAVDIESTRQEASDAILQFLKGQGDKNATNFQKLKRGLDETGIQKLELGVIKNIFERSLIDDNEGLKVFDSRVFKEQIQELLPQFESKAAKETLELFEGFHKLFLNDGNIAWELKSPSTGKEGSGLATTISGAARQKSTKIMFENILRLLGEVGIPLTPIKTTSFNEKTRGAALRFHIRQALKQSVRIDDFTKNLTQRAIKTPNGSATQQALRAFASKIDQIYINSLSDLQSQNLAQAQAKERGLERLEAQREAAKEAQSNIPFASTKANFTKEEWENLSTQERIQAYKDQRARERAAIKAQLAEAEARAQAERIAAHQEKRNAIQAQKDSNAGKAINEVDLNLGDSISYTHLKPTRINLENKDYPAEFAIINKNDLKPNFNTTGTQGRTQKQDNVIQDIQENLNPNKLFFSEGGFDGLPIILQDGSIAVGNHRAQALKNLSQESLKAYKEGAKEAFNVDLKDDELIVRMLDKDIPKQEILNLSFASNIGREQNLSEKALSTIGKYQDSLEKLPPNINAQSVEEMQNIVSKTLDPTNNGLNTFDTNLALFASLSRSGNKNILESLNAIKGSVAEKQAVLRMFVENAGNFYNLTKQTQMPNIDLRPYLNQILFFTASAKESRVQNFQELISEIDSLIKTTDLKGSNIMLEQNPSYYEDLIGKILGYSFARFKELENPSKAMFEFLNNIQSTLRQELEPTLFSSGRPLETADIYDFLSVSIKSGIPSDETSKLLDLLPQLKAKQEAFKAKNELLGNSEKLESVSKKNLHTENAVVKENLTTEAQKETESQGISQAIKDIIDTGAQKGRDMQIIGQENFTPEVVEYVQQQNKTVAIEKLSAEEAESLGFKYPQDVRVTIDYQAINHTLNRHGAESNLVKQSGQEAVDYSDIAKYREYAKGADETLRSVDNGGSNVLVSYKQVNGHFVVVEQIKKKNNELGFKTLFKESGNYKDSASYKDTKAKAQTLSIGYEPSANSFALTKSSNSKEIISQTAPKTEAEIIDFVKNAEKEVESMERFHLNDPKYYYQVHKPDTLMAYEKEHFNNIPKALQEQLFEKFPKIQAQKFADNLREHDLAKEFKEFLDKNILNKPFAKSRDDLKYILSQLPQKDLVDLGFKSKQDFLAFESTAAKANFGKIQAKFKKGDYLGLPEKWSEYQTLKQRESIEQELNLNPTAEFGTNYAEFFRDGKGAIEKIMTEKQGQVSGAFYREDLKELSGNGDIDLVWGEVTDAEAHTGYGLAHIIDKRTAEFMQQGFSKQEAEAKALEFVESLPKMIEEMDLKTKPNEAIKLENDNFEIILKSNWKGEPTDNKWIVSAYIKKEKGESISSTPFTKKDNLSLNSNEDYTTKSKLLEAPNQNTKLQSKAHIGSGAGDTKTSDRDGEVIQSNAHIGSGIVSGSVAGFETDEQGNLTLDPQKFLLGLAGGAVGSKAIAQGFKAIHKNPEFKEKLTQELADTLSKGWETAVKQYPILESLQPRYIVKNEKGRIAQSKAILKEVEKEEIYRLRESTKQMLHNIAGKNITNAHDGRIAQVSKKNIGKMVSDKAIAKSVANGFSAMEHFNAVNDIESLYKNAIFKETTADKHGEIYLKIHRYNAQFENANALITLKETTEHGNKIYTLELEGLEAPTKQVHSQAIGEQLSKSRKLEPMHPNTPLENSNTIIPQIQEKFKFDEKKAKDLAEWHQDSSPLTKDEQGLPKVFYHGTGDDYGFEIFKPNAIDGTPAIYFTTSKKVATSYAQMGYTKEGIYKTFLNIKNPLVVDFSGKSYDGLEYEKLLKKALKNGNDGVIIKNVFDDTGGYYDKQGNFKEIGKADTFIVFNPNQIKAVENKGLNGESGEHKYFNAESPNIYQSNVHIGNGLASGSVAGFETDEQGNLTLDPQKFLLGLAGGAVGSKAISKAVAKATELRVKKLSKAYPQMAKNNPQLFKEVFKKDLEFLAAKGTYNTLTSFFNKHKILDLNPQIFAGEKALLSGEFAPQKAKLQAAKDMLKAGKSDIQIWQSTGWFKDLDNHWKFEINPSGGEFLKDYDYMLKTNQHFGLSQILDDKALFEAYPELRGVFVSFEKDQSAGSYYAPKNNFIQITQKDEGAGIEALYHEIQHAVQNIEKFATGSGSGLEHHTLSYGEIEARNVERRFSSEFQKQHPHQSSELNPKIRAQNIKDFKKMELLERKIEKSKADIESYREKLEDYSYSPRYNAETYNKKFETLRKKEKNLEALEYQRDMIEGHNSGYWTGEYYKDNPTIKPILNFMREQLVKAQG